jgi:hypothetical protein
MRIQLKGAKTQRRGEEMENILRLCAFAPLR